METFAVYVKFRKPIDVSAKSKDKIIHALPGSYKVNREALVDMDQCNTREFKFKKKEVASNFAERLSKQASDVLDIRTDSVKT